MKKKIMIFIILVVFVFCVSVVISKKFYKTKEINNELKIPETTKQETEKTKELEENKETKTEDEVDHQSVIEDKNNKPKSNNSNNSFSESKKETSKPKENNAVSKSKTETKQKNTQPVVNNTQPVVENKKQESTQSNQNQEKSNGGYSTKFYESITGGKKEFASETEATARGTQIQNAEYDYVLDWNEKHEDNQIKVDIQYFRVYPSVIDENGKTWYYLHFFCYSGEGNDVKLKSMY